MKYLFIRDLFKSRDKARASSDDPVFVLKRDYAKLTVVTGQNDEIYVHIPKLICHCHAMTCHIREELRIHYKSRYSCACGTLHCLCISFRRDHGNKLKIRNLFKIDRVKNCLEFIDISGHKRRRSNQNFHPPCLASNKN